MDVNSTFQLEANKPLDRKSSLWQNKEIHSFIQVFRLRARVLIEVANENQEFRRFLVIRATQRRAHFQKVFEETCHYNEIRRKMQNQKLAHQRLQQQQLREQRSEDKVVEQTWFNCN